MRRVSLTIRSSSYVSLSWDIASYIEAAMKTKVYETSNQDAWLFSGYSLIKQSDDLIFGYFLEGYNATTWGLNAQQVSIILAGEDYSVTEVSRYGYAGCFSIGIYKNWLYNHSLFENPDELKLKIKDMLLFSLYG